ncbi:MAG: 6-bladed beta-propeller [Candidatus Delongbacteria bacterium]|nr:6-bladed beta-propeller [Candidatus Delongbacteria bacterium]MDD4205374.1 6-bladed beta-propeller [Candidatus Delongbacteria bacterium]
MKKSLCVILALIALIIFSGCSKKELNYTVTENDGIKTFHNKNIPANADLKIIPKELFTIAREDSSSTDSTRTIHMLTCNLVDSKNNNYLLDTQTSSIKKFDSNGKFIKAFGRSGHGPGETVQPTNMAMFNDTIYVLDHTESKFVRFDCEGNFIDNIPFQGGIPEFLRATGNKSFLGFRHSTRNEEGNFIISLKLNLMDKVFNDLANFNVYEYKYTEGEYPFFDMYFPYIYSQIDDMIYISVNSENEYKIKVYDEKGKLDHIIQKNYIKTKFSENELDDFNLWATNVFGLPEVKGVYKKAINGMYIDKYNRLLVNPSIQRNDSNKYDYVVDVFDKGVFQNRLTFNITKGYDYLNPDVMLDFCYDRIYLLDMTNTELRVFEY